jgi:DNA-binding IclR family transcriptional regulator
MPPESPTLHEATGPGKGVRARGLDRAFGILKYLRERRCPVRPSEIAVAIGAPKSSVYEVVNSLLEKDILEYVDGEGRIFLGRELHFLGSAYLSNFDLTREADSYLERITLETRETSQLCMLSGNRYTVVLMREGARSFRISSDVGELVPLPWTASGRLLTSHLAEAEIRELIPDGDFVLPNGSRLACDAFLSESRAALLCLSECGRYLHTLFCRIGPR